jgi:hypothetical protein
VIESGKYYLENIKKKWDILGINKIIIIIIITISNLGKKETMKVLRFLKLALVKT